MSSACSHHQPRRVLAHPRAERRREGEDADAAQARREGSGEDEEEVEDRRA